MAKINIFSENIFECWDIDEKFYIDVATKILRFYFMMMILCILIISAMQ